MPTDPEELPSLPALKLIICSTPRSSSNALTVWLTRAGIGRPTEHFHEKTIVAKSQTWGLPQSGPQREIMPAYSDRVQRLEQANGVFATKIHWHQMERSLLNPAGRALFDGASLVFLQRRNLLEQAASMRVAMETGVWFRNDPRHDRQAEITARQGERLTIEPLLRGNSSWLRLFASLNRTPLFLTDEDVNLRPVETIVRIADLIGRNIDAEALRESDPSISKYTDDRDRKDALIAANAPRLNASAFSPRTYRPPQTTRPTGLQRGLNRVRRALGMGLR